MLFYWDALFATGPVSFGQFDTFDTYVENFWGWGITLCPVAVSLKLNIYEKI